MNYRSIIKNILLELGIEVISADKQGVLADRQFANIFKKYSSYTMIVENIYRKNLKLCQSFAAIDGCVVECGVWRGGMSAGIAEVLGDRSYYLFDSFEGLPEAQEIDGASAKEWQNDKQSPNYYENCKAEIEYAERAMQLSGVSNYHLIKGWFIDTLPKFDLNEEIAILRLDGDWYDSTMQCLEFLYPKVAKGGLIILDDYYAWDGCSRAVHDYFSKHSLPNRIYELGSPNCYTIKI